MHESISMNVVVFVALAFALASRLSGAFRRHCAPGSSGPSTAFRKIYEVLTRRASEPIPPGPEKVAAQALRCWYAPLSDSPPSLRPWHGGAGFPWTDPVSARNHVIATEEYGKRLIAQTTEFLGPDAADPKMRYTNSRLACASCHIGAGARTRQSEPGDGHHQLSPRFAAQQRQ